MEKNYIRERIKDTIYPKAETPLILRETVRGIILNEKKKAALLHIVGEDKFGKRDHYETPGGGVNKDESYEEALHREIKEELGLEITALSYIGTIEIEYNLLNRIDIGNFFVAEISGKSEKHLEDYEKELFKEVVFVPLDRIDDFYKAHPSFTVGSMIHERDSFAFDYYLRNIKK